MKKIKLIKLSSLILCAIVIGCLISLLLLEITLRSDFLKKLLLPRNVITTNINTFERIEKDISLNLEEKKPQRILILGDSFIRSGHKVDKKIKRLLKSDSVSILNLAYSGYSPTQYLATFENFAHKFKPTLTIISYYVGNDLTDTKYRFSGANTQLGEASLIEPHKKNFSSDRVMLYSVNFLEKSYNAMVQRKTNLKFWKERGINTQILDIYETRGMNPWFVELGLYHQDFLLSNLMLESKSDLKAWGKNKQILNEIQRRASAIGSKTVIVIFPHTAQVNKYHYKLLEWLHITTTDEMLATSKPQDLLISYCRKSGLSCLDLLPYYRAKKDDVMFWEFDEHMNKKGQEFAGKLIVNFIKDSL